MRLRQIAVVADNLAASRNAFMSLVDAPGDFTDLKVGEFANEPVVALGHSFLKSSRYAA